MSMVADMLPRHSNGKKKTRGTSHKLRRQGKFPSAQLIHGQWLVDPADVERYLQSINPKEHTPHVRQQEA